MGQINVIGTSGTSYGDKNVVESSGGDSNSGSGGGSIPDSICSLTNFE
jgi:hypothetical protein